MREILEDLFYGEVKCHQKFEENIHYQEANMKCNALSEQLKTNLDDDQLIKFESYLNTQSELNALTAIEAYVEGFRNGTQLFFALFKEE